MYRLVMDGNGNHINYGGTLVRCLYLARRFHARLGMTGTIYRPDGTNMNIKLEGKHAIIPVR